MTYWDDWHRDLPSPVMWKQATKKKKKIPHTSSQGFAACVMLDGRASPVAPSSYFPAFKNVLLAAWQVSPCCERKLEVEAREEQGAPYTSDRPSEWKVDLDATPGHINKDKHIESCRSKITSADAHNGPHMAPQPRTISGPSLKPQS